MIKTYWEVVWTSSLSIEYLFACLNTSSLLWVISSQGTRKMECPGWCFAWKSIGWHPYCMIQLETLLAQTVSWNPLVFHFPTTWCFAGYLCSDFSERNIGSGLARLWRLPKMCSWYSMGGGETRRELSHVGWLEKPCTSIHHSLCRGSWVAWSAWCDQIGRSFHRTLWIWAPWTLWAAHS